ncbi:MAG: SpoIID/LytB domain-containing protein [Candidatus Limnocylindrales bacterium]
MRIAPAMLAAFASVFALVAVPVVGPVVGVDSFAVADARHRGHCTEWSSNKQPPPTIRVYRVSEGMVDEVDFKVYVTRVVSREWNVKQRELRKAGAVAVKQYAWFHVLHYRGGSYDGKCYDVKDSTADQLYASKPISQIPRGVKKAVQNTWSWRLRRPDGTFPMTGYRGGENVGCAENVNGYKLYVRSAKKCAAEGWSAEKILTVYYESELETTDAS